MAKDGKQGKEKNLAMPQIEIPKDLKILYADSVQIMTKRFGVILDVAQQAGPTNRHQIVARIGMSRGHAKALCEQLLRALQQTGVDQAKAKKMVVN
ncbi:hypothetical protein ACFL0Y_01460 [Patescibacteria group bacterium]